PIKDVASYDPASNELKATPTNLSRGTGGAAPDGGLTGAGGMRGSGGADAGADARQAGSGGAPVDAAAGDGPADDGRPPPCTKPGNHALRFGGKGWVAMANSPTLEVTDLTIEAWVSVADPAPDVQSIISFPEAEGISDLSDAFAIWYGSGALYAGVALAFYSPTFTVTPWLPEAGRWYHLALTYDHVSGAARLYIDGRLVAAWTDTGGLAYDKLQGIRTGLDIGDHGNSYRADTPFIGDIDEVMMWSTARSAAQIAADMHTCTPAAGAGMVGYWSFDEGVGQTAADGSGNGNSGTLTSASRNAADYPAWISSSVPF